MYESDFAEFKSLVIDLCMAHDKPVMDDRTRVYWEALKGYPLPGIRQSFATAINGDTFPKPKDLIPRSVIVSGESIRHPNEDLIAYVLKRFNLTARQISLPWIHIAKFFEAPGLDGKMRANHGATFVGVEIPQDGESPSFRVTHEDMQTDQAWDTPGKPLSPDDRTEMLRKLRQTAEGSSESDGSSGFRPII